MRSLPAAFAFLFALLATAAGGISDEPACAPGATLLRDGTLHAHRCVTTAVAAAQAAFDDGLTRLYAFNPEEARVSFARAAALDPALAMAWWGVATTHAPNINQSYDAAQARRGHEASVTALALAGNASPVERALIGAAAARFEAFGPGDEARSARAYRDAMNAAARSFPNDDDVRALAAEAEMDVHAWSYFTPDGRPTPGTLEAIAQVRAVLARTPEHVGANHFAIHLYEESAHPEEALASAQRLARDPFEPAAEHLTHMPAHAFMRVGDYDAAGDANANAVRAYVTYLEAAHAGHEEYLGHDCVFGVDAFLMAGEAARARALATLCHRNGSDLEALVDLRSRDWAALAGRPRPGDFAGGLLLAHDGRVALAGGHLKALGASSSGASAVEADVLEAALARATRNSGAEIAALQRAVAVQDGFGYAEPPPFFYPVRETLGAAYARAGRLTDAERTFRADLDRNRDNPRALFGLAETLARDGKVEEAAAVRARFQRAWARADTDLTLEEL